VGITTEIMEADYSVWPKSGNSGVPNPQRCS
jgi:hypothetical protein